MLANSRRANVLCLRGRFASSRRNSTAWSRAVVGERPQKPDTRWNERIPIRRASRSIFARPRRPIMVLAAPLSETVIMRVRSPFSSPVSERRRTDGSRRNVSSRRLLIVETPRTGRVERLPWMCPALSITAKVTSPARLRATRSARATRFDQQADSACAAAGTSRRTRIATRAGRTRAWYARRVADARSRPPSTFAEPQRNALRKRIYWPPDGRLSVSTQGVSAGGSIEKRGPPRGEPGGGDRRTDRGEREARHPRARRDAPPLRPGTAGRGARDPRGRPRRRQDAAGEGTRPVGRPALQPRAVHARPAALRRDGRLGLQPAHQRVRVPARPGVHRHPAGRRDQPRLAEDAGGAARVHAGEPGHRRRCDLPARRAVHGD